jgi:hypothetical protein
MDLALCSTHSGLFSWSDRCGDERFRAFAIMGDVLEANFGCVYAVSASNLAEANGSA